MMLPRETPSAGTPLLFWDVDTQVDFIDAGGKLYVRGAETIVPRLKQLTDWAANHEVLVVASVCAHRRDDPEFAIYGPHCLAGTPGQVKIAETRLPETIVIPTGAVVPLPADPFSYQQIVLEKRELDVFSNPNTDRLLERLSPIGEIVLYGVVSEICVAFTARGLLRRGHRLRIASDAIRALDEPQAQALLAELTAAGAQLETTHDLLDSLAKRRAA